jgi:integrase
MEQTREPKTETGYIKKALQAMNHAYKKNINNLKAKSISKEVEFNNKKVMTLPIYNTVLWYCKEKAHSYMPNTWRYYRSSFNFYAEKEFENGNLSLDKLKKIKLVLSQTKSGNKTYIPKRTSAKKSKNLNEKDLKVLINKLKSSNSKWGVATMLWIQAGIIAGLRPIEWSNVEIAYENNGGVVLIVKNAKSTNKRSHGKYRTIDLSFLKGEEKKLIENHIKIAHRFFENNLWDDYYNGCSNLLRYTTRKIWKSREKYPTLYTSRHQFSANIKADGSTPEEVAALMGHASDETAQEHYGKKRYGSGGRMPKANSEDVKNVKIKNKTKFEFKDNKEK